MQMLATPVPIPEAISTGHRNASQRLPLETLDRNIRNVLAFSVCYRTNQQLLSFWSRLTIMRISGGTARGKLLAPLAGQEIRPTPDKVRQALFNILRSRLGALEGLRVLDLFSGTGALAIEALSRGAKEAVLIDQGRQSALLIPKNLRECRVWERAVFFPGEVLVQLPKLSGSFDIIFLDPPYDQGLQHQTLIRLSELQLLAGGGVICAETGRTEELPDQVGALLRETTRFYGSTALHFYSLPPNEADLP